MKPYRTKLKHDVLEAVREVVQRVVTELTFDPHDLWQKAIISLLREVDIVIYRKMAKYQPQYTITLTPAQALALAMVYQTVNIASFVGAHLQRIHAEVTKQYA